MPFGGLAGRRLSALKGCCGSERSRVHVQVLKKYGVFLTIVQHQRAKQDLVAKQQLEPCTRAKHNADILVPKFTYTLNP